MDGLGFGTGPTHTSGKMGAASLLLMILAVSGYSYVLRPRLTVTKIAVTNRNTGPWSAQRADGLQETSVLTEERRKKDGENQEATGEPAEKKQEMQRNEGLPPGINHEMEIVENDMMTTDFNKRGTIKGDLGSDRGYEKSDLEDRVIDHRLGEDETVQVDDGGNLVAQLELEPLEEGRTVKESSDTKGEVKTLGGLYGNIHENGEDGETSVEFVRIHQTEEEKQGLEKEERESELVAGIGLHEGGSKKPLREREENAEAYVDTVTEEENTGGKVLAEGGEAMTNAEQVKLQVRKDEKQLDVSNLTPSQVEEGIATPDYLHFTTPAKIPPPSPRHLPNFDALPPPPPPVTLTPFPEMVTSRDASSPTNAIFPSVANPSPATSDHVQELTTDNTHLLNAEVKQSVLLVDLNEMRNMTESTQHHFEEEGSEVKVDPSDKVLISSIETDNIGVRPAKEPQTIMKYAKLLSHENQNNSTDKLPTPAETLKKKNSVIQIRNTELTFNERKAAPKPKGANVAAEDLEVGLQQPNPERSTEPGLSVKPVQTTPDSKASKSTGKPKPSTPTVTEGKITMEQSKVSLNKPSATPTPHKITALKSSKASERGKNNRNKKRDKSKGKKRKKNKQTRMGSEKKKIIAPTYFPYFKDNYCPPECACYGRVVQCSDKSLEKIPYGIPYNARYILLMNNHIDSIQLDLFKEYLSIEFLVLSNNRLTDGSIEGAFEGVQALKRLYLDMNLLESVPTDLPASLEELRLDNNHLSVMSEAVWVHCPGLSILSLSNNSLGNGSDSLPAGVLSPLENLRTLSLDRNWLASVPLGLPPSIKELYLRGNRIWQFRGGVFNGMSELLILDLSANRLTNKGLLRESLLNVAHLESLNLEGNRFRQVPQHLPLSLKTLNLEGNLISSINKAAFIALPNLEHLGLARNKIFRVAPGAFRSLPVLHQLDLCHNSLRQVPRQLPWSLQLAALAHNRIQSVPRDAFCWGNVTLGLSRLVQVQLEHNLLDLGNLDAQTFRCLRGFQVVRFY